MRELFRNNSPGALTLEQARELEIKRHRERRRQAELRAAGMEAEDDFTRPEGGILGGFNPYRARMAQELAAQGRGSDTEVAHVTLGEIVLPRALHTPGVIEAIRQAAAEANIPLDRLRIGSTANSINPQTGMPEFNAPIFADGPIEEILVERSLQTSDPSTNKMIEGMHPSLRYDTARFINAVQDRTGTQLRIPSGDSYRTIEEQDAKYAKGRTAAGRPVTPLRGGESYHNYGLAFDVAPLNPDGKTPNYNIDLEPFAPIAKEHGLEWGGNFKSRPDRPHFQRTYGYTVEQLRQMMEPGGKYPTIPGRRNR